MMTLLKYEIYRRWRWLVLRYAAFIIIGIILLNRVSSPAYQYEFIGESMGKFADRYFFQNYLIRKWLR